jgi:hypothetical protein
MPWGPFEALGKTVTVLIPESADPQPVDDGSTEGRPGESSDLERALRHVEHAAEKCAEFAQLGNGSDQGWSRSLETWEWLRNYLTSRWMETEPDEGAPDHPLPGMPGAAATLEVVARALRNTPLASWRDVIGAFNPDAPTREEAIQTILGVAKLLSQPVPDEAQPSPRVAVRAEEEASAGASDEDRGNTHGEAPTQAAAPAAAPSAVAEGAELSFDYAAGFDEGYQMGRKVGLALGAKGRSGSSR